MVALLGYSHLNVNAQRARCLESRRRYDGRRDKAMIELTEQQIQALNNPDSKPLRLVNPRTKESYVLLSDDEYEHLKEQGGYDDSPWTREELQALAWERVKHEDWDEYDELPEKP